MGNGRMNFSKRYPLYLGTIRTAHIQLVGCGGTGSWLAQHLARLAYEGRQRGVDVQLHFIDFDTVEARNVGRQNFTPAMVGHNKAEILARLYGRQYGLPITHHSVRYSAAPYFGNIGGRQEGELRLIIGAVDTTAGRREIQARKDKHWWLDCGNDRYSGQVVLGNAAVEAPEINPFGFCSALPWPSMVHPELIALDEDDGDEADGDGEAVSCVNFAEEDSQSLLVNQQVAHFASVYVQRLLFGRLDMFATYFDLLTCSSRSEFIVQE